MSEPLWGPDQLGAFLGYRPSTVRAFASRNPAKLPPRVQTMAVLRWVPSVCQAWAERNSGQPKNKGGRPRLTA